MVDAVLLGAIVGVAVYVGVSWVDMKLTAWLYADKLIEMYEKYTDKKEDKK